MENISVCSLTLKRLAVTIPEAEKSLRRKERRHTLKCSLLAKDGAIKEKFRKNSQTVNSLKVNQRAIKMPLTHPNTRDKRM